MSRTAAVAAMVLVLALAGCATDPQAAPPTITTATTIAVSAPATTTAATENGSTTTTTAAACELRGALDAVWMVEAEDGHGTAFHIGDGEWITAAHVVGDSDGVVLRHGSKEIGASVVGIDHDTDVALLDAATESPTVLLAQDAPGVGSDVLAAGYPLYGESEPSVTRGVISRLERDIFLGELLLTDTAMNPGNSGGPLLTECGDVAGMVVQKIVDVDVEGIGYAVTASELLSQLPRLRSGYRTAAADPEPVGSVPETTPTPTQSWYIDYVDGIPWAEVQATYWEGPQTTPDLAPALWVSCLRSWLLWWPNAFIYAPAGTDLIATDWGFDDGTTGFGSWRLRGEGDGLLDAVGWTDDLDAAARDPDTSTVFVMSWNGYWEDQVAIGTAVFPLDGYAETMAVLQRECP